MKSDEKELLETLMTQYLNFVESSNEISLQDFVSFLSNQIYPEQITAPVLKSLPSYMEETPIKGCAGFYLGRLYRYSLIYSKAALEDLQLGSVEDFKFLRLLSHLGTPTKSELIRESLSEYTTGIETLKRLHKIGLISEFADQNDKRVTRVKLTSKGKTIEKKGSERMAWVSNSLFNALSENEIHQLIQLLDKIHFKHSAPDMEIQRIQLKELIARN